MRPWVSDVLFSGFCQVSGPGSAASGPLLCSGQPVAAVSYGRNHLPSAGPPGQLHLVFWWTRRWRTAGKFSLIELDDGSVLFLGLW